MPRPSTDPRVPRDPRDPRTAPRDEAIWGVYRIVWPYPQPGYYIGVTSTSLPKRLRRHRYTRNRRLRARFHGRDDHDARWVTARTLTYHRALDGETRWLWDTDRLYRLGQAVHGWPESRRPKRQNILTPRVYEGTMLCFGCWEWLPWDPNDRWGDGDPTVSVTAAWWPSRARTEAAGIAWATRPANKKTKPTRCLRCVRRVEDGGPSVVVVDEADRRYPWPTPPEVRQLLNRLRLRLQGQERETP